MTSMRGDPIPADVQGNFGDPPPRRWAPIRSRTSMIDSSVWERHRDQITQLFSVENRSLAHIQRVMGSEHNLFATSGDYKRKISEWHLERNGIEVDYQYWLPREDRRANENAGSSAIRQTEQAAQTESGKKAEILRDSDHMAMLSLSKHHSYRSMDKDDTYTKGKQLATDGRADEGNRLIWDKTPDASSAVGRRARSRSVPRVQWDSPFSSHTSVDLRARHEAEELDARRCRELIDEHIAQRKEEELEFAARRRDRLDERQLRREEKIRQQDEEIRRRPPIPLKTRQYFRPVIDQTQSLLGGCLLGPLSLEDRVGERVRVVEAENTRARDRAIKAQWAAEEEEAMKQNLLQHTPERPCISCICLLCHATFYRGDHLIRHVKIFHETHLKSQEEASIYAENSKSRLVPVFGKEVDLQKINMEFLKKWILGKIQEILGVGVDIHHPVIQELFVEIERNRFLDIKSVQIVLHKWLGAETLAFCEELWQQCRNDPSNPQGSPKELLAGRKVELAQAEIAAEKTAEEAPQSEEAAEHDSELGSLDFLDTQFQEEFCTDWSITRDSGISGCNKSDCEPAYVSGNFHSRIQCQEADQYAERSSNDSALSDGESTDTGSAWMSDYSDVYLLREDHPFNLIKPTVVREGLLAYQNAKQRAQAGSSTNATSGTPSSTLGAKDGITTLPRKRGRNNQDGSEDAGDSEEDDDDSTTKRRRTSKRAAGNQPSFACPFAKKNPLKYRGCYAYVLKRVRDVKQHLSRFHQLPIYCPRCTDTFEAEDERDEHIRTSSCLVQQENMTFEGVTRSQKMLLGQRVSARMSASDQWFTIFDILFPGHTPRPNSAYINTELTVELEAFQDLMYTEGPRLISSAILSSRLDISAVENVEDDSAALLQSAIQDGLQQVFQQWSASMSGIEQESIESKHTTTDGSSTSSACPGIQGSELARSSSKTLVEDIQERNATAGQEISFREYESFQNCALPQGMPSSSEVMVADASTLFRSNTDLPNSNSISNADIQPENFDEYVLRDALCPGSLTEDSWKEIEIGNFESGGSWNFDLAFDEARGM